MIKKLWASLWRFGGVDINFAPVEKAMMICCVILVLGGFVIYFTTTDVLGMFGVFVGAYGYITYAFIAVVRQLRELSRR